MFLHPGQQASSWQEGQRGPEVHWIPDVPVVWLHTCGAKCPSFFLFPTYFAIISSQMFCFRLFFGVDDVYSERCFQNSEVLKVSCQFSFKVLQFQYLIRKIPLLNWIHLLICMAPCQAPKDLANQILHSQSYQSAAADAKLDVGSMKFLSVPAAEFFSGTLKNQTHKISASFPDVL